MVFKEWGGWERRKSEQGGKEKMVAISTRDVDFLAGQHLRLCLPFTAGGPGSIPSRDLRSHVIGGAPKSKKTRIPHAAQCRSPRED